MTKIEEEKKKKDKVAAVTMGPSGSEKLKLAVDLASYFPGETLHHRNQEFRLNSLHLTYF